MEERNACRVALGRGEVQVVHATQELRASMTERRTEHPMGGKEDRLEAARDQGPRARLPKDRRRAQS
jgi:hypothetical protein